MKRYLEAIEKRLDEVLPRPETAPRILHEAMRYAVGTGGKRIRPVLCLASAEAVGGTVADALAPACAIELLHNYTLIHDDLPAMDNDVERRGQPTVWKRFGEANAILAGDALLALAYQVAARTPRQTAAVVGALGEAGVGVVRGQVEDLRQQYAGGACASDEAEFIYLHKTSDLFVAAATMGGLSAGADERTCAALSAYARNLGLAFQFEDDLLDGDGLFSREETVRRVESCTTDALKALTELPGDVSFLRELAVRLTRRTA